MKYTPHTEQEVKSMLRTVGVRSVKGLFADVPKELLAKRLPLPRGLEQPDAERELQRLADKNKRYKAVLRGAGAYRHYIPAVVRDLSRRSEFVTAYTPYQAEMSQGILQSIFEYQSMICRLTGMDVSNASHYDGATAAAEACLMCRGKRDKVWVSPTVKPQTLEVLKTYLLSAGVQIVLGKQEDGATITDGISEDICAVYFEQPNYFGIIEDGAAISAVAHAVGAKLIVGVNPISLGLLKKPAEYGADIAVGEGQPLGMPTAFGGPYLGFMATTDALMRKMPGRIVGETIDRDGNRAYVLTMQAREQHIRREKAGSNICSNEAHCALVAAMYLTVMGDEGMERVAEACISNAHYLAAKLIEAGLEPVYGNEFFHEFLTTDGGKAEQIATKLKRNGILPPLSLTQDGETGLLWCATELIDRATSNKVAGIVAEVLK